MLLKKTFSWACLYMCSRFSLGRITRWNLGRCNKHLDNEKGSEKRLVLTMKMKGNGKDWRWIRAGSIFELLRHFEGAATNAKGISCLSRLAPPVHCATLEDRNGVRNLQVGRWMSLGQYGSNRVDADSVFVSGRWINSFELRPHSTISFPSTDVRDDDQHFEKRRRGVGPCWCDIFQTSQTWTKMLENHMIIKDMLPSDQPYKKTECAGIQSLGMEATKWSNQRGRRTIKSGDWRYSIVCFQLLADRTDEEAKYQFPGPYNWKGERRKDLYLTKSLRYHRKSRGLP